jgi:hypothetical protein
VGKNIKTAMVIRYKKMIKELMGDLIEVFSMVSFGH